MFLFLGVNFVRPITFNVFTFLFLFYFYNDKFLACSCWFMIVEYSYNQCTKFYDKSIIWIYHFLLPCVDNICLMYCYSLSKQFPYLLRSCDVGDFKKCNEASYSIHLWSIIQIIKPFLLLLDAICNISSMILIRWYFSSIRSK